MADPGSVREGAEAVSWWRLRERLVAFAQRHPVLVRRARTAWVVWAWLSILWLIVALIFVPSLRVMIEPWLWCYFALIQIFVLSRTKTLSWRFAALVFTAGVFSAVAIGLAEVRISALAGTDVNRQDGSVLIAGPVEETLKLIPLLALLLAARRRVRGFAVTDFLIVGFASGAAFQAVEDAIRRMANIGSGGGLLGLLGEALQRENATSGMAQYGFGWLPGWSNNNDEAFFPGHAVSAALVAVTIGLALRAGRRWWRAVWMLPVAVFAMVVVDHALYNNSVSGASSGDHTVTVPGWVISLWQYWGHGTLQRPMLTVLLMVAMVLDVRRVHRAWPVLPPVPALAVPSAIRNGAWRTAQALRGSLPADAAPIFHRLIQLPAATVQWLGITLADILHDLALPILAAAPDPALAGPVPAPAAAAAPPTFRASNVAGSAPARPRPPPGHRLGPLVSAPRPDPRPPLPNPSGPRPAPVPAAGKGQPPEPPPPHPAGRPPPSPSNPPGPNPPRPAGPRRHRWFAALFYLRTRRQLAHETAHQQRIRERARRRRLQPVPLAAGAMALLLAGLSLTSTADAAQPHLIAFLANLFDDLADWWSGLSPAQQILVVAGGAALLTLGGLGFWSALGIIGGASTLATHGHGAATFLRDPRKATGDFLRNLTPQQLLGYGAELALARLLPAGLGAGQGRRFRRSLDELQEDPGRWMRYRRQLLRDAGAADFSDLIGRRRGTHPDYQLPTRPRRVPTGRVTLEVNPQTINRVIDADPRTLSHSERALQNDYRNQLTGPDGRALTGDDLTKRLADLRAQGHQMSRTGHMPNAKYAGQRVFFKNPQLAQQHPDGVYVNLRGYPDFAHFAEKPSHVINLPTAGDRNLDIRTANRLMRQRGETIGGQRSWDNLPSGDTPAGYVWHHIEGGQRMVLIPERVHQAISHAGGIATAPRPTP